MSPKRHLHLAEVSDGAKSYNAANIQSGNNGNDRERSLAIGFACLVVTLLGVASHSEPRAVCRPGSMDKIIERSAEAAKELIRAWRRGQEGAPVAMVQREEEEHGNDKQSDHRQAQMMEIMERMTRKARARITEISPAVSPLLNSSDRFW